MPAALVHEINVNLHKLMRHLQNPGGATSSLPVRRRIAGSEDAAPPMHEVLQVPLISVDEYRFVGGGFLKRL